MKSLQSYIRPVDGVELLASMVFADGALSEYRGFPSRGSPGLTRRGLTCFTMDFTVAIVERFSLLACFYVLLCCSCSPTDQAAAAV